MFSQQLHVEVTLGIVKKVEVWSNFNNHPCRTTLLERTRRGFHVEIYQPQGGSVDNVGERLEALLGRVGSTSRIKYVRLFSSRCATPEIVRKEFPDHEVIFK